MPSTPQYDFTLSDGTQLKFTLPSSTRPSIMSERLPPKKRIHGSPELRYPRPMYEHTSFPFLCSLLRSTWIMAFSIIKTTATLVVDGYKVLSFFFFFLATPFCFFVFGQQTLPFPATLFPPLFGLGICGCFFLPFVLFFCSTSGFDEMRLHRIFLYSCVLYEYNLPQLSRKQCTIVGFFTL